MLKVKAMILIFSVTTYHIEPNDDFLKKQKKQKYRHTNQPALLTQWFKISSVSYMRS